MGKWTHLRMRFPPFEALSHNPQEMEFADVYWTARESDTYLDLGEENGWFIHRSIVDDRPKSSKEVFPISGDYDTRKLLESRGVNVFLTRRSEFDLDLNRIQKEVFWGENLQDLSDKLFKKS